MKVKIKFRNKEKEVNVQEASKVKDVLKKADINRETVIIKRNNEIIPAEEEVKNRDNLEAIRIISGG